MSEDLEAAVYRTINLLEVKAFHRSRHVVFIRRSQFCFFDGLNARDKPYVTERELGKNIEAIIQDSDKINEENIIDNAVGVLTSQNRQKWAEMRNRIINISSHSR